MDKCHQRSLASYRTVYDTRQRDTLLPVVLADQCILVDKVLFLDKMLLIRGMRSMWTTGVEPKFSHSSHIIEYVYEASTPVFHVAWSLQSPSGRGPTPHYYVVVGSFAANNHIHFLWSNFTILSAYFHSTVFCDAPRCYNRMV